MILSHDYRFIFLKPRKAAGTSLEIALSAYCGPDDVITPVSADDEALRRLLGYPGPRGYEGEPVSRNPPAHRRGMRFWNHMPADEVRAAVGPRIWREYRKVTIERHPWDKALSLFYWRYPDEPRPQLRDFLRRQEREERRRSAPPPLSNWPIYAIGEDVAADIVLSYEAFDREVERLAVELGLPGPLRLPHAKSRPIPGRRGYREVMGDLERELVQRLCRREIERFGYRF